MSMIYKLSILYLMQKVDFSLTGAQISECMLETLIPNYFTLRQLLAELEDAGFITSRSTHNTTYYTITESGIQTLDSFGHNIPVSFRDNIDASLDKYNYQLRQEHAMIAEYSAERKGMYIARCEIRERGVPLIALSLNVPREDEAAAICDNWRQHGAEVYEFAIRTLMK